VNPISRRTVLGGIGAGLALPWLEGMAKAGGPSAATEAAAPISPGAAPLRLLFVYVPNGVNLDLWTPAAEGPDFALPPTLAPLSKLRSEILVLSGLALDGARPYADGAGDHARASASFLTGAHPAKTDGAGLRAGVSVDQAAAAAIGNRTRFRSLEVGCEGGAQAGSCDSGYACAYSANLSWRTPETPATKEVDPRLVYERLFGEADESGLGESAKARAARRKSLLDCAGEDARSLRTKLGADDRRKLDEYLHGIREIERRLERAETAAPPAERIARPTGVPADYGEHAHLLSDLVAAAFQADVTRIATFSLADEGSNRSYAKIGIPEGHHDLSHHGSDTGKLAKVGAIDRFHVEILARLLEKLAAMREGEHSVLDSSMVVFGSGISDGNRHNHDDLPILLAGRGGGSIAPGRHVRYPRDTPLCTLYLALLDRLGVDVPTFGDATGKLQGLSS
jgi:hypothetical protein